ncbi:MAG: hypothetical protein NZM43_08030 [Saprospiraceae bacterium]|nr:hypothetical protein [Saprospiraceae bacterium]MDW8484256.1 hypothetical protein [Saprospiraceae bacterium]
MRLSNLLNYTFSLPRYRHLVPWVLVAVVIFILFSSVVRQQREFIAGIQVNIRPLESGASLLRESDVRQRLILAFGNALRNMEIGQIDLYRIERVVEEDPFVAQADAYLSQDGVLHIRIKQREPVLRVLDNEGSNYYLDQTGAMMPFSRAYTPRVLVATGNISPYTQDFMSKNKNILKDVFSLANILREDPVWSIFIQQIHVNQAGEFILVPLIGNQKILLGSLQHIEAKLKRLKVFYQQGMPYVGWRKYQAISLKYNGQIVCW